MVYISEQMEQYCIKGIGAAIAFLCWNENGKGNEIKVPKQVLFKHAKSKTDFMPSADFNSCKDSNLDYRTKIALTVKYSNIYTNRHDIYMIIYHYIYIINIFA